MQGRCPVCGVVTVEKVQDPSSFLELLCLSPECQSEYEAELDDIYTEYESLSSYQDEYDERGYVV